MLVKNVESQLKIFVDNENISNSSNEENETRERGKPKTMASAAANLNDDKVVESKIAQFKKNSIALKNLRKDIDNSKHNNKTTQKSEIEPKESKRKTTTRDKKSESLADPEKSPTLFNAIESNVDEERMIESMIEQFKKNSIALQTLKRDMAKSKQSSKTAPQHSSTTNAESKLKSKNKAARRQRSEQRSQAYMKEIEGNRESPSLFNTIDLDDDGDKGGNEKKVAAVKVVVDSNNNIEEKVVKVDSKIEELKMLRRDIGQFKNKLDNALQQAKAQLKSLKKSSRRRSRSRKRSSSSSSSSNQQSKKEAENAKSSLPSLLSKLSHTPAAKET